MTTQRNLKPRQCRLCGRWTTLEICMACVQALDQLWASDAKSSVAPPDEHARSKAGPPPHRRRRANRTP